MTIVDYWPDAKYWHGDIICAYCGEDITLTEEIELTDQRLMHKECADELRESDNG